MFNNITPIALNLIIINVLVFASGSFLGEGANEFLSLHYIEVGSFHPIQFFTYMFAHASLGHLFGNMLGIFFFGSLLERYWGAKKFLIYYIVCGVGAGVIYSGYTYYEMSLLKTDINFYLSNPNPDGFSELLDKHAHQFFLANLDLVRAYMKNPDNQNYIDISLKLAKQIYNSNAANPMLGASGAVFGILIGVGMLFPFMEIKLLFPPIPLKMIMIVTLYGLSAFYGIVQQREGDNVAHFAHLGGMVAGFILLKVWGEKRSNYY